MQKVGKAFGIGLGKHAAHKFGVHFRKSQSPRVHTKQFIFGHAQGSRRSEELIQLRIAEIAVQYIGIGVLFQPFILGGNIVSQYVQFQDGVVEIFKFKVGGDGAGVWIVCRVLHRTKIVDFISLRHDDDPSGVLPRGSLDANAAADQSFQFRTAYGDSFPLQIFCRISESGFFCQRADCSGTEGMPLTKQHFCIFMGVALDVSRKVQVNIRRLISIEAQKGFKRNIVAVPDHIRRTAFGAILCRQIKARFHRTVLNPFAVSACRTAVVGRQRIYLGDAAHSGCKGGSYRPSGSHLISFGFTVFHQAAGYNIHDGKAVFDDRIQLTFQTRLYLDRQGIAVHRRGHFVAFIGEFFFTAFNMGRIGACRNRIHFLYHIGDFIGVGDYYLVGFFFPQIGEFLQHFLCCTHVQMAYLVRVCKFHTCQQNAPVNFIFRINIVGIAGSAYRFVQLFT